MMWCCAWLLVFLLCAGNEGEGLPDVQQIKPDGDYVCKNIETKFCCSFDRPDQVNAVRWNIEDGAAVDLSNYTGHYVDTAMIAEGKVIVTVNTSHIMGYYICSVFYRGSVVEDSPRYQPQHVPTDVTFMAGKPTNVKWLSASVNWEINYNDTDCIDFRVLVLSKFIPCLYKRRHDLNSLSPGTQYNVSVQAMVNGECVAVVPIEFQTSIWELILIVFAGVVLVVVVIGIVMAVIWQRKIKLMFNRKKGSEVEAVQIDQAPRTSGDGDPSYIPSEVINPGELVTVRRMPLPAVTRTSGDGDPSDIRIGVNFVDKQDMLCENVTGQPNAQKVPELNKESPDAMPCRMPSSSSSRGSELSSSSTRPLI